jgi:hypothetical protein
MKSLKPEDAQVYLDRIGMEIGVWNQISDIGGQHINELKWLKYRAPEKARELYIFSQHIAEWLPSGIWKLLQIDNSTTLDICESNLFCKLVGIDDFIKFSEEIHCRTFLMETSRNTTLHAYENASLTNLIYTLLLFECHAYIISSESRNGERIGIQDGFAYYISRQNDFFDIENSMKHLQSNPLASPRWVVNLESK